MATLLPISSDKIIKECVDDDFLNILWGPAINQDVFNSWAQGFTFSIDEPLALIQYGGGPCAVIVSVQAFIMKNLLFQENLIDRQTWLTITDTHRESLLASSLCDLLCQATTDEKYILATDELTCQTSKDNEQSNAVQKTDESTSPVETACQSSPPVASDSSTEGENCAKKQRVSPITPETFHQRLICKSCSTRQALLTHIREHIAHFQGPYGVLFLLYSVLLTKGKESLKEEIEDVSESLINEQFGHGSQSLINLFITGTAVTNVWDNDKDVSGMRLRGICKQSTIGFLSLHEHLRYCEVGWYLKNPQYPIWVLGSESHLTVLFSQESRLVCTESAQQLARRMFGTLDTEGNGFLVVDMLGNLLQLLKLENDPEYVKFMESRLDPEQLGVFTMNSFLGEFYPGEPSDDTVTTFTIFHYNGYMRSSSSGKVVFNEATATLMDAPEVQFITENDTSDIQKCLLTKWPTLNLKWKSGTIPSMQ